MKYGKFLNIIDLVSINSEEKCFKQFFRLKQISVRILESLFLYIKTETWNLSPLRYSNAKMIQAKNNHTIGTSAQHISSLKKIVSS